MIIEQIKSLNEYSTKEEILKLIKTDFKKFSLENDAVKEIIKEKSGLSYSDKMFSSNVGRYFKYRRINTLIDEGNRKNNTKKYTFECDNCSETKAIYNELNWDFSEGSDTINSFATLYSYGLVIYYPKEYKIKEDNTVVQVNEDYCSISNAPYFYISKYNVLNNLSYLEEFAGLTHSFGNFMPSLYKTYNSEKGLNRDIKDCIDLMLEYVKRNNSEKLSKDIVTKLCLEDYIYEDTLKIKFLFKRLPNEILPVNKEAFKICICEINKRIKIRALRIIMKVNENKKVHQLCKELIESISVE